MKFELKIHYGANASTRHMIEETIDVVISHEEEYFEFIKKIREMLNI